MSKTHNTHNVGFLERSEAGPGIERDGVLVIGPGSGLVFLMRLLSREGREETEPSERLGKTALAQGHSNNKGTKVRRRSHDLGLARSRAEMWTEVGSQGVVQAGSQGVVQAGPDSVRTLDFTPRVAELPSQVQLAGSHYMGLRAPARYGAPDPSSWPSCPVPG